MTDTPGLSDAEAVSAGMIKVFQRCGRSHQRFPVGSVGDGAGGDVLETGVPQNGKPVDTGLNAVGNVVQIRIQFLLGIIPGHTIAFPLLAVGFIHPQNQGIHFLAQVDGFVRVPHQGQVSFGLVNGLDLFIQNMI